jgi:hypothetical protein
MTHEFRQSRIGTGAFAISGIAAGDTIRFFTGEILCTKDLMARLCAAKVRRDDPLQIEDDLYIVPDDNSLYFNHSCDPSAGVRRCNELFALRNIRHGEEITFDYSTVVGFSALNHTWSMRCMCASANCRHVIRSALTLPSEVLRRYAYAGALPDFVLRQCARAGVAEFSYGIEPARTTGSCGSEQEGDHS